MAVVLALDQRADAAGQLLLGGVTWAFLLLACRDLPVEDRVRVGAVVLVATCGEVVGSILLGFYTYRLDNLPAFVPPGHGLIYVAGLRASRSPWVRRHARSIARAVLVGGSAWAVAGLTLAARPDVAGACCMAVMAVWLVRTGTPMIYAGVFVAVTLLEFYGTAIGTWEWRPIEPYVGLSQANPPCAVAAGYCLFDATARALGPWLLAALRRPRPSAVAG